MDKRWFKQYEKGVPHTINTKEYSSLIPFFEEACQRHSKKVAYSNLGNELHFDELRQHSRNLAAYLQQLGLTPGARVAIMLPNTLQYPVSLFGILLAGYVVVNTNPLYTPEEVIHQMNDSGAEALIVLANFGKTIEKVLPHTPKLQHVIVTELGDLFPWIKKIITNAVVRHIKKLIPQYQIPHAVAFSYALLEGSESTLHRVKLEQNDIAFLQYTGGTTGIAKGAILTHGNILANVFQATAWITPLNFNSKDIVVTALPLYHIFSLTANCLIFLALGAKNILITNPRDLTQFIQLIKKAKFTVFTGVNTLFNALLHHPKLNDIDFGSLRLSLAGGMALQKTVAIQWAEKTHSRLIEAYGLTEASPAVTINPISLPAYNGSIGLPISSTTVKIIDEDERELPIGSCGELCVKGPQVMPGYWNRPDETALVFTKDGYLKTGDIAQMDEEGFIYLVDRKKDMIVVSGFNVYPNEVEQVISMHPGVLEVGVIGIQDEESGERVKACIVKKDPDLSAEQIISHCREHLTAYKVPKSISFVKELPKTSVGKILRRALK